MTDAERVEAVQGIALSFGIGDKPASAVATMEAIYLQRIGTRLRDNPDTESRLMSDSGEPEWFEMWREARRQLPAKPFD